MAALLQCCQEAPRSARQLEPAGPGGHGVGTALLAAGCGAAHLLLHAARGRVQVQVQRLRIHIAQLTQRLEGHDLDGRAVRALAGAQHGHKTGSVGIAGQGGTRAVCARTDVCGRRPIG